MSQYVIGIDPGLNGGLALLDPHGKVIRCDDMPVLAAGAKGAKGKNRRDYDRVSCWAWLQSAAVEFASLTVVLEQLQPMPKNGCISAFKLGAGLELWATAAVAASVPLERVRPQRWQKALGVPSGEKGSLARAREMFPGAPLKLEKHSGRAAAILLAEYGRRFVVGGNTFAT